MSTVRPDRPDHPPGPAAAAASTSRCSRIELRRMLRNRRTIIFALVFPAALFFVVRLGQRGLERRSVGVGNVAAYIMVSMALYGAALTAASDRRRWSPWSGRSAGRASCG